MSSSFLLMQSVKAFYKEAIFSMTPFRIFFFDWSMAVFYATSFLTSAYFSLRGWVLIKI